MRYLKSLQLLFFLVLTCSNVLSAKYQKPQKVVVSGRVENKDKEFDRISVVLNRPGLNNLIEEVKLDSCGNFHISLESYIATDVWIEYKTSFLAIVHPTDSIYVTFNGNAENPFELLGTVDFSGTNAKSNTEIAAIQKLYYASPLCQDKVLQLEKTTNKAKSRNSDSLRFACDELFAKAIKEVNPSQEAYQWAKMFIYSDYVQKIPDSDDLLLNFMPISKSELICGSKNVVLVDKFLNHTQYKSRNDSTSRGYTGELVVGELMRVMEQFEKDFVYSPIKYLPSGIFQQIVFSKLLEKELQQENVLLFKKYEAVVDEIVTEAFLYYPLVGVYNQINKELRCPDKMTERNFQCQKAQIALGRNFRKLKIER